MSSALKPSESDLDVPRLERRLHDAYDGIPYFDEVLQVPQSPAHVANIFGLGPILQVVAAELDLTFLSDEPIWYQNLEDLEQRVFYGDCVFARTPDRTRITSEDLLLVIEVVSTNSRRKELKDTEFHRHLNAFNRVPEFALVFPDLADPRALTWCRLDGGGYDAQEVVPGGRVESETVPGLAFEVLPRDQWREGYKLDVFLHGIRRLRLADEHARAEHEAARAEQEAARAEQEAARAEQEAARAEQSAARAERLALRLRELGIDPDDA